MANSWWRANLSSCKSKRLVKISQFSLSLLSSYSLTALFDEKVTSDSTFASCKLESYWLKDSLDNLEFSHAGNMVVPDAFFAYSLEHYQVCKS